MSALHESDCSTALDGVLGELARLDPFGGVGEGQDDEDDGSCATGLHLFVDGSNDEERKWRPSPSASSGATFGRSSAPLCPESDPTPTDPAGPAQRQVTPLDSFSKNSLISSLLYESVNDLNGSCLWDAGALSCAKSGEGVPLTSTKVPPPEATSRSSSGKLTRRLLDGLRDSALARSPRRNASTERQPRTTGQVSFLLPPCLSVLEPKEAVPTRAAAHRHRTSKLSLSSSPGPDVHSLSTTNVVGRRSSLDLGASATRLKPSRLAKGRRASMGAPTSSLGSVPKPPAEKPCSPGMRPSKPSRSVRFSPEIATRRPEAEPLFVRAQDIRNCRFGLLPFDDSESASGSGDSTGTLDKAPKRPQRRNSFDGGATGT